MQRECGGVFERNSYCAMILVPRTNNRNVCRRKYEIVRQTKFQPHTNIASPWDAYARATPLLQTLRPYGTRPLPLHRFYKHGVPTGRWTPPITPIVNRRNPPDTAYGPRKKSISLYQTSYGCPPNLSFRQYAVRLTNRSQRDQMCSTIIERRKPSQRDGTFVAQS